MTHEPNEADAVDARAGAEGQEEPRHPTRRAVLKAAWGVPVVVSLGSLEFDAFRGGVTSSVGTLGGGGGGAFGGGDKSGWGREHGREMGERGKEGAESNREQNRP